MNEVKNYTVAVYAGEAPVTDALLVSCSHPLVVLGAATMMLGQAEEEGRDDPKVRQLIKSIKATWQEATQEAKQS